MQVDRSKNVPSLEAKFWFWEPPFYIIPPPPISCKGCLFTETSFLLLSIMYRQTKLIISLFCCDVFSYFRVGDLGHRVGTCTPFGKHRTIHDRDEEIDIRS